MPTFFLFLKPILTGTSNQRLVHLKSSKYEWRMIERAPFIIRVRKLAD